MKTHIDIDCKITDEGLVIHYKNRDYAISYPSTTWKRVPSDVKRALRDNISLAVTMHLPMVIPGCEGIRLSTNRPALEPYFLQNFIFDIPSCCEVDETDMAEKTRQFLQLDFNYAEQDIISPDDHDISGFKALVGMSFGKDSLLTFAVADEIGLDPEMIYVVEDSLKHEQKHKRRLAENFKNEFGKDLHVLRHETGLLRDYSHLDLPPSEFGWGLQNTEYALEFIPFAYALQARYIFFGNEQSTAATYLDETNKWRIYPCYDQTHVWTKHIDQITQLFTGRSVKTGSLIEPLMDMMIQAILINRYPEIAKYQMSCFTATEAGKDYHWCHQCSVCAKMYLLAAGSGMNPAKIGFKHDMLESGNKHLFTLFGGKSALTYANTGLGRDEQLFAFYLATKKGNRSALVENFRTSKFYEEAKERESELIKIFCTIYDSISLPKELKEQVISIYREEINSFEF